MKININHNSFDHQSFRALKVKSMFNCENDAASFNINVDLPIEENNWQIGVIVGASGSGKTSLGKAIAPFYQFDWPHDQPIIDVLAPNQPFNDAAQTLTAAGLGSVPAWLRPYHVLSTGEQFRANMAMLLTERPDLSVIDEFTSVLDRQVAKIGSAAFEKAWRKGKGKIIFLTPHYDVLEWLAPDWVYDTATQKLARGCLRRSKLIFTIHQTNWQYWPYFEPHHYLKAPRAIAATCYIACYNNNPIAHIAMSTRPGMVEARACRLVVLPEWQGIGVGMAFLNEICRLWRYGINRYQKPMPTLVNTTHPGLCKALRTHPLWCQISCHLYGANKVKSRQKPTLKTGYGGHFRAIQGFRYIGTS